MKETKLPSGEFKEIKISAKDLPLSCPTNDMQLWNGHPKVYLPIEVSGEAICPYCGTHFVLTNSF